MMEDIKALREGYNLTRNQFSDIFMVPLRTVQSWELGARSCPSYVFRMFKELLKTYDADGLLNDYRK